MRAIKKITLKNGAELTVRKAEEKDAEMTAQFKILVSGESDFLSYGKGELEITVEKERENIRALNMRDNAAFIIAEINGDMAGFITFAGGDRIRTRHAGEMGIVIQQKYWGLSIGGFLIEYLIGWAKQTEVIRKINLRTRTDNVKAIKLYERYGFRREGVLTRNMYISGKFFDSYLMGMEID